MPTLQSIESFVQNVTAAITPRLEALSLRRRSSTLNSREICKLIFDANELYLNGFAQDAFDIVDPIITIQEKFDIKNVLIYIACCVEMDKRLELDILCSKLWKKFKQNDLTLYAYAAYNFLIKDYELAKDLIKLCLEINPDFGYAYVLSGHLHFCCGEILDQMDNYMEASNRLEKNMDVQICTAICEKKLNGLPHGVKHLHDLETYMNASSPFVMNELGAVFYIDKEYDSACACFLRLIKYLTKSEVEPILSNLSFLLDGNIGIYWNPVYFNLGYTLFTMKKYFNALACFQKAVTNGDNRQTAWEMIGFCFAMLGMARCANAAMFKANILDPKLKDFIPLISVENLKDEEPLF